MIREDSCSPSYFQIFVRWYHWEEKKIVWMIGDKRIEIMNRFSKRFVMRGIMHGMKAAKKRVWFCKAGWEGIEKRIKRMKFGKRYSKLMRYAAIIAIPLLSLDTGTANPAGASGHGWPTVVGCPADIAGGRQGCVYIRQWGGCSSGGGFQTAADAVGRRTDTSGFYHFEITVQHRSGAHSLCRDIIRWRLLKEANISLCWMTVRKSISIQWAVCAFRLRSEAENGKWNWREKPILK